MANKSGIEWTELTWNPNRGCRYCYAMETAHGFSDPEKTDDDVTEPAPDINAGPTGESDDTDDQSDNNRSNPDGK